MVLFLGALGVCDLLGKAHIARSTAKGISSFCSVVRSEAIVEPKLFISGGFPELIHFIISDSNNLLRSIISIH